MKKLLILILTLCLGACAPYTENTPSTPAPEQSLFILAPKGYEEIENVAKSYLENAQTKIQTDDYFDYLKIALNSENAPTLFIVEDKSQLMSLEEKLEELSGEEWVNNACVNTLASQKGRVYSMPATLKGIGIVYNSEILKQAGINPENLNSLKRFYDTFEILEDRIEKGDFKETFPRLKEVFATDETATYFEELEELIDEYSEKHTLKDFANEKTVAILSDTDVYYKVKEINEQTAEKLNLLPITVDGKIESKIILTPTHYWAINKDASYEQKKTAKEFLLWLYTGDGRQYLNTLNFINPITTFEEIPELPPLLKDLKTYADTAKTTTLE